MRARVLGKTWVRACLLVPAAIIVVYGLSVVWMILVEDGHRAWGDAVGDLDFASLLAALFLGPVWVLQAFRAPAPPGNNGRPGGGDAPVPTDAPGGSGALVVDGEAPILQPTEIDEEIRAMLDQESVRPQSR